MNIPLHRRSGLRAQPTGLAEATAVAMGESLCAIFFDRPQGSRQRLGAQQDGHPIPPPLVAVELALRSGGTRQVLFVPQPIERLLAGHVILRLGDQPAAQIDPAWLQPPLGDLVALAANLSGDGKQRLLRVVLTTAASLFPASAQSGLAAAAAAMTELCDIKSAPAVARTQVGGRTLLSYRVPGGTGPGQASRVVASIGGRLLRLPDGDCLAEGDRMHVLLPKGAGTAQLLVCPERSMRLDAAAALPAAVSAQAWIGAQNRTCRDWLLSRVGGDAVAPLTTASGADLVQPRLTVVHLSLVPAGVLHALVLEDPSDLVRRVFLERHGQQVELVPTPGLDGSRVLTGLAELPGLALGSGACRIRAVTRSGQVSLLAEAPSAPFDGAIPDAFRQAWSQGIDALGPLARARGRLRRPAPPVIVQRFGAAGRCRLRIVTPVGQSADLVRARAALILAEGLDLPVEVVCTTTAGPLAIAARHMLAQTVAIYGVPHRLVLLPEGATSAECLHAGLSGATDAPALVLGTGVLPERRGWLQFWLQRLRRQGALAPALLAGDGSIAATCEGVDPWRGLPASELPGPGRTAPRPLADCLALGVSGIARLLGSGVPHPDAAIWIAEALGGSARTETRLAFRRFGPAPALDDFDRALAEVERAQIRERRK